MDCIFCRIARGELPAHKLYEDDRVMAFLDIQPGTEGHALVIPKAHARDLFDMEEADRNGVMAAAHQVATALVRATGAEGLNLHQSNGKAAGQVVFHFHLHLLPRRQGDTLRSPWIPGEAVDTELQGLAERVRALIPGRS